MMVELLAAVEVDFMQGGVIKGAASSRLVEHEHDRTSLFVFFVVVVN